MTDLTSSSSRPKGSLPFPIKRRPVEVGYQTRILAGNSNLPLAQEIAKQLGLEMTPCRVQRFANGEIDVKICENVRGDDVFILQSPCNVPDAGLDVNTALMELLLLIHTARLASAKRITAVMPYYAYSRQDRKTQSRVPISASVVAQLIQSMGVDRVITLDLHCGQIQGFFRNLPLDNLSMSHEFVHFLRDHVHDLDPSRTVVVSPDAGGVERATAVADMLRVSHVVTILRRRVGEESGRDSLRGASTEDGTMHRANPLDPEGEIEKKYCMQIVGDVSEYTCVIVDDMIDTGSRLVAAANALHQHGAKRILACATHGILTDPACSRIMECPALEMVCVTDGIPQRHNMHRCPKLVVLSLAPLLAHAIDRVHEEQSLSEMFRQVVTGNELVLGGSMIKL